MKITFIVPCKDLSGGLRVVSEYGNALLDRGHQVCVIYPRKKESIKRRCKNSILKAIRNEKDHLDQFRGELKEVDCVNQDAVGSSDCVVATAWQTAEWIKTLPASCGDKFYLIQDYEVWSDNKQKVEKTYYYPYSIIVISNWLKEKVFSINHRKDIPVIMNGTHFECENHLIDSFGKKFDVGMMVSRLPRKCSEDGVEALQLVRNIYPDIKCVFFGSEHPNFELSKKDTFYLKPSKQRLERIYLDTRIWISPSVVEGFGLPILEAMRMKCAVVSTDNKGVSDFVVNNLNGLLVPTKRPDKLAESILTILQNPSLEKKLQKNAVSTTRHLNWENATKQFEKILYRKVHSEI